MDDRLNMGLHVSNLAGPLCTLQVNSDWCLGDLQRAIEAATKIPLDEQRLVAGPILLAGSSKSLMELLPEDTTDILCVRTLGWCTIPVWSGGDKNSMSVMIRRGHNQNLTQIEHAKAKCIENETSWGFTYVVDNNALTHLDFKNEGSHLALHNKTGFTCVRLTSAGRDVLLQAIRQSKAKRCFVEPVRDLEVIIAAIQENAMVFKNVCSDLRSHPQVIQAAVHANPFCLQFASEESKADRELIVAAIARNAFALQHASEDLKADRALVMMAIKSNPSAIRYASESLRSDRDICLAALVQSGITLKYACKSLQDDRELVIVAVRQNGEALMYASKVLRADPGVVKIAIQQNPAAIEYKLNDASTP